MRIKSILKEISFSEQIENCEIEHLETDSRNIQQNTLYFCVKGTYHDGHDFAQKALEQGAKYVIVERDMGLKEQIIVKDTREALALACNQFYEEPSKKLKVVAVTGTNGKTSCTYLIKSLLEHLGHRVGLIGTIQNMIGSLVLQAKYTTPEPMELYKLLGEMVKKGCTYVVMEVSSHGLEQKRVHGLDIDVAVFTNLTQDHLDYHKTMEEYFKAKEIAFTMGKIGIINIDDSYGQKLVQSCKEKPCITYGIHNNEADYLAKNLKLSATSVQFELLAEQEIKRIKFGMPGEFSVYNALASIGAVVALGHSLEEVSEAVLQAKGVVGRAEVLYDGDFTVICDYAHTADGLEQFLKSISPHVKGKLYTLFGCAGERDWTKREKMGEVVATYSDFVILTSDNPRKENPLEIFNHVIPGIEKAGTPFKTIADRYGAILWAFDHLDKGDVLCLAGKGHEDYQVLYSSTIYFNEHEIVEEIIRERGL